MTALVELPHISHSQLKSWRHCKQQWDYRYGQLLIPKRETRPLYFGNWFHTALQSYYEGKGWREGHEKYVEQYDRLTEDEQQLFDKGSSRSKGPWEPLPLQIERAVRSYIWYYEKNPSTADGWKVVAVEIPFELEVVLDDGRHVIIKGRIDLIVQDRFGKYWVVDHKTTTTIPAETAFHSMDPQQIIYPAAVEETMGIKVEGVIYNYILSRPPSIPKMNKDGKTIAKQDIKTDYLTLYRFLKDHDRDPLEYSEVLAPLQAQSPLLARYRLPRTASVTERILAESKWTAAEILDHETVTRNVTRQCDSCSYQQLCRADLFGLDTTYIREQFFVREDASDNSAVEYSPAESAEAGGSD
jgi:RecB family exonuclease